MATSKVEDFNLGENRHCIQFTWVAFSSEKHFFCSAETVGCDLKYFV